MLRRRWLVDTEFSLAMLGILVMIINNEIVIDHIVTNTSAASVFLKSVITITTIMLLVAVCLYHVTGIQLYMTDNGLEDYRLAISPVTFMKISIELLVCAMHPLPVNIEAWYYPISGAPHYVSIDGVLSILMMLRLYLIGKFMVVHSRLLSDTSTQSLGALNKVKINTRFVFKALMSTRPGSMLLSLMGVMFLVHSWAMRTCEMYYEPDHEHNSFLNNMWLIAITFLTVGYGEIIPNSYCGRFIAVSTGLMGVGTTALLVAVLAQKLTQSRAEKYVHTFSTRIQLEKQRKNAAADVIKQSIHLWRYKRRPGLNDRAVISHHGKLLKAIALMREAKSEMSQIAESALGVVEVCTIVNDIAVKIEQFQEEQQSVNLKLDSLNKKFTSIDGKLDMLYATMTRKQ